MTSTKPPSSAASRTGPTSWHIVPGKPAIRLRRLDPTFWKCTFTFHKTPGSVQTVGLDTTGLQAGHVWLNGHNLGESPQVYPLYMPECWIKDGANDLVVFDLNGSKPNQLKLTRYEAFSVAAAPPLTGAH